jgi:GxxExxY protein
LQPNLHETLTKQIIGAFHRVDDRLGFGFLEKVHESALMPALAKKGLRAENQHHDRGVL